MSSTPDTPGVYFGKLRFEWKAHQPASVAVSVLIREDIGSIATIADHVPAMHPNSTELTDRAFQIEAIVCEIFGDRDPDLVKQRFRTSPIFQNPFREQTLDDIRQFASDFMDTGMGLDQLRRELEVAFRNTDPNLL